jgi:hypothetical protein
MQNSTNTSLPNLSISLSLSLSAATLPTS